MSTIADKELMDVIMTMTTLTMLTK